MTRFRHAPILLALMLPIVVIGFWRKYFGAIAAPPLSIHIHAFLLSTWVLMLIAQAWLIRTRRRSLHRSVGKASFVLGPLIIWSCLMVTQETIRDIPGPLPPAALIGVTLPLGALIAFAVTWCLAMYHRRRPQLHARYMISSGLAIISAALARAIVRYVPDFGIPTFGLHANFAILELVSLALVVWDWRGGRTRSPFIVIYMLTLFCHVYWMTALDFTVWDWIAEGLHRAPRLTPWG